MRLGKTGMSSTRDLLPSIEEEMDIQHQYIRITCTSLMNQEKQRSRLNSKV